MLDLAVLRVAATIPMIGTKIDHDAFVHNVASLQILYSHHADI